MVTPEERITRLEAVQEAILQRFSDIISRQDALLLANESLRRDLMQAIDVARQETREANEVARQEAREANESARKEAREANEASRKDARNLFIAAISIGAAVATGLGGGLIALMLRILERLPA